MKSGERKTGSNLLPTRLVYDFHAFDGPSTHIELSDSRLMVRHDDSGFMGGVPVEASPRPRQWQDLRQILDEVDVWSWKRSYAPDQPILDGGNWLFHVAWDGRRVRSSGYVCEPNGMDRVLKVLFRVAGLRRRN